MARLAIGSMVVLALALAALSRSGDAQQFVLPTPKGQLGGAPAAPSVAVPVTPPVPPLATIPIVLAPAPTSAAAPVVPAASTVVASGTPQPDAVPAAASERAARSVVTVVVAGAATGSGTVVAGGQYVVTALDAVGTATTAEVIDAGGARAKATVVGVDPESGLAVLQFEGVPAPALAFARAPLAVGEPVGAIGGMAGRVGPSIVSRVVTATDAWFPAGPPATLLIAIDAPLGANGGALVESDGLLAGVLVDDRLAGATPGGTPASIAAEDVRYAVPAATVARVVGDLMRLGHVDYPWLGVAAAPVPDAPAGPVRVASVFPDSPAARAGIEPGDVLLGLDGQPFGPDAPASVALLAHAPGDRVRVELRRDGVDQTLAVILVAKPAT